MEAFFEGIARAGYRAQLSRHVLLTCSSLGAAWVVAVGACVAGGAVAVEGPPWAPATLAGLLGFGWVGIVALEAGPARRVVAVSCMLAAVLTSRWAEALGLPAGGGAEAHLIGALAGLLVVAPFVEATREAGPLAALERSIASLPPPLRGWVRAPVHLLLWCGLAGALFVAAYLAFMAVIAVGALMALVGSLGVAAQALTRTPAPFVIPGGGGAPPMVGGPPTLHSSSGYRVTPHGAIERIDGRQTDLRFERDGRITQSGVYTGMRCEATPEGDVAIRADGFVPGLPSDLRIRNGRFATTGDMGSRFERKVEFGQDGVDVE